MHRDVGGHRLDVLGPRHQGEAGPMKIASAADSLVEVLEDLQPVPRHASGDLVRVVLADDAAGESGRPGGDCVLLEQRHLHSPPGQMEGDGDAVDPAADYDDVAGPYHPDASSESILSPNPRSGATE